MERKTLINPILPINGILNYNLNRNRKSFSNFSRAISSDIQIVLQNVVPEWMFTQMTCLLNTTY